MCRSPSCISKEGLNKGAWTALEDQMLTDYVKNHGEGRWGKIPKQTGLKRCGKSCRLRWLNYLRPDIKRGNISQDEEDLIIRLHRLLGNRWSLIAGRLPGRTDNEIKNYWNSTLGKKVQGIYSKQSKRWDPIKEPSSEIITSPKIKSHFFKTKPKGFHNDSTVALPSLSDEYRPVEVEPSTNEVLEKNKEGPQKSQSDYSDELLTNDTPWEFMMDLKDGQISLSEVIQAEFVKLPLNNLMMVEDYDNGSKTWSPISSLDEYHLFFEEFW